MNALHVTRLCDKVKNKICVNEGRRGRGRMVVGSTNTYAISAYHH
jgi:hypothetical protein